MAKKRPVMDSFFRENISEFELPESQGNWESLNHLLDVQQQKKRNRRWIIFFFLLFSLFSSGYLIWKNTGVNPVQDGHLKTSIPGTQEQTHTNTDNTNNANPSGLSDNGESINQNKFLEKSSETEILNSQFQAGSSKSNKAKSIIVSPTNNGLEVTRNTEPSLDSSKSNPKSSPQAATNLIVEDLNSSDSPSSQLQTVEENKTDSNKLSVLLLRGAESELNNQNSVYANPTGSIPLLIDTVLSPVLDSQLIEPVLSNEIIPATSEFLKFSFVSGANLYNTSEAFKNSLHLSPIVGLEYKQPLSIRFAAGIGVWYSLQGGYQLKDTVFHERYFFDRIVSQRSIHIRKKHKLYFPATLYYSVAKNHTVFGSLQLSYLVNTIGDYNEVNETTTGNTEIQKNNVKGYMDGIKSTNLAVSIGYQYRISRRFDVSGRISRDLTVPYVKEYFYGINTDPSLSYQILFHVNF